MTRDEIRAKLTRSTITFTEFEFGGCKVLIKSPSVGVITKLIKQAEDPVADMLLICECVLDPITKEKIFTKEDLPTLMEQAMDLETSTLLVLKKEILKLIPGADAAAKK